MSRTYRWLLRLLPAWLRERAGAEMLALHEEKIREVKAGDWLARLRVWLHEVVGLLIVSVRSRREAPVDRSIERRRWGVESLGQDIGFALRTMWRRPAPAILAIVTCALGIGGASAMFGVVDGVLLRPLPYPHPERIVSVYPTIEEWRERSANARTGWDETFRAAADRASFSWPEFEDWMSVQTSFEMAAALANGRATLTGLGAAEVLSGPFATPDLFPMLGADPVLGRTFDASDGMDARRIVLSWSFWQNRLGGAPDVIGRTVLLDDRAHEIIGVLPRTFSLTGYDGEFWRVLGDSEYNRNRDNHDLRVVARLRVGVTIEGARQETATILRSLSERHGGESRITHLASVFPRLEDETRQVRTPLLLLLAGSGLLLLVACVNFAALRLGAGIDRETELLVRAAMGAGRLRIARQMVTESIVLALLGAAAGLLLAFAITRGLTLLAPAGVPRLDDVTLDARATLFAMLLAIVVGVAFGMVPALTLSRSVSARLHAGRHGSRGRQRLHSALVIAQTGLATVLLVCAGVLTRTLLHLDAVDPGFEPVRLLTVRIQPPYARFRLEGGDLNASVRSYYDRLIHELETVPGVTGVALASTLPFSGDRGSNEIVPEGHRSETDGVVNGERHAVSGNYLELIGARLVEGRLLQPADDRPNAAPVVVVSERLARRFWPDGAVGRRLDFWAGSYIVVGVITDMRDRSLRDDAYFRFYVPQQLVGAGGSLVIKAAADPTSLIPAIRARLADVDPDLPVTSILPMSERITDSLAEQRYRARLAATFALLAAAFTAFGIYGVTSRSVARRRPEIGVRLALGARPGSVVTHILRHGLALASAGVVLGLAGSLAATQAIASYVYGTQPNDPFTLAIVAAGLVATSLLACLAPSIRAARTDPLLALRSD